MTNKIKNSTFIPQKQDKKRKLSYDNPFKVEVGQRR